MALLGGELEEADTLGLVGAGAGHVHGVENSCGWPKPRGGEMRACGIGLFASAAVVNGQTFNFFRFHESKMLQGNPVVSS